MQKKAFELVTAEIIKILILKSEHKNLKTNFALLSDVLHRKKIFSTNNTCFKDSTSLEIFKKKYNFNGKRFHLW
jgi:hypothetical protein